MRSTKREVNKLIQEQNVFITAFYLKTAISLVIALYKLKILLFIYGLKIICKNTRTCFIYK